MRDEWIEVDGGVRLAERRSDGDAVPFLLVHGPASNARVWDGMAERPAAVRRGVAAVDLRGHRRSDKPADGCDDETPAEVAGARHDATTAGSFP